MKRKKVIKMIDTSKPISIPKTPLVCYDFNLAGCDQFIALNEPIIVAVLNKAKQEKQTQFNHLLAIKLDGVIEVDPNNQILNSIVYKPIYDKLGLLDMYSLSRFKQQAYFVNAYNFMISNDLKSTADNILRDYYHKLHSFIDQVSNVKDTDTLSCLVNTFDKRIYASDSYLDWLINRADIYFDTNLDVDYLWQKPKYLYEKLLLGVSDTHSLINSYKVKMLIKLAVILAEKYLNQANRNYFITLLNKFSNLLINNPLSDNTAFFCEPSVSPAKQARIGDCDEIYADMLILMRKTNMPCLTLPLNAVSFMFFRQGIYGKNKEDVRNLLNKIIFSSCSKSNPEPDWYQKQARTLITQWQWASQYHKADFINFSDFMAIIKNNFEIDNPNYQALRYELAIYIQDKKQDDVVNVFWQIIINGYVNRKIE